MPTGRIIDKVLRWGTNPNKEIKSAAESMKKLKYLKNASRPKLKARDIVRKSLRSENQDSKFEVGGWKLEVLDVPCPISVVLSTDETVSALDDCLL